MTTAQNIQHWITLTRRKRTVLRRNLTGWYHAEARDLPWRRTRDPYRIWLSEILLQQTRVEAARSYYERFLESFPDVETLAAAPQDKVLKRWEGAGYYARARNLHGAAKLIVRERGGLLPRSAEAWRKLPGVGRYTAGAVASIAFDEVTPVVDGNVKRVLARIFNISERIDAPAVTGVLWEIAALLVPKKEPGTFNQALMELGALVCLPRSPRCEACPVRRHCEAYSIGDPGSLPVRGKKRSVPHKEVVAGLIEKGDRYLLAKRPARGMLAGLWELPGGALVAGESHEAGLRRIVRDEIGMDIEVGSHISTVSHGYTHFTIRLHLYRCRYLAGEVRRSHYPALRWITADAFARYALPGADRKALLSLFPSVDGNKDKSGKRGSALDT